MCELISAELSSFVVVQFPVSDKTGLGFELLYAEMLTRRNINWTNRLIFVKALSYHSVTAVTTTNYKQY